MAGRSCNGSDFPEAALFFGGSTPLALRLSGFSQIILALFIHIERELYSPR